jgi:hypothetical protein
MKWQEVGEAAKYMAFQEELYNFEKSFKTLKEYTNLYRGACF